MLDSRKTENNGSNYLIFKEDGATFHTGTTVYNFRDWYREMLPYDPKSKDLNLIESFWSKLKNGT